MLILTNILLVVGLTYWLYGLYGVRKGRPAKFLIENLGFGGMYLFLTLLGTINNNTDVILTVCKGSG